MIMLSGKSLKEETGTTLVEVLIAVAITTMVTLAVLASLTQGVIFGEKVDGIYDAALVAQRRIEEVRRELMDPDKQLDSVISEQTEIETPVDADGDGVPDHLRTTQFISEYDGYSDIAGLKVTVFRLRGEEKTGRPVIIETIVAKSAGEQE